MKAWGDESKKIQFKFENIQSINDYGVVEYQANFKSNVFLVKLEDEKATECEKKESKDQKLAVLKVCSTYDIECHDILAKLNLAPQIIGYEEFSNNCFILLMEYFDCNNGGKYKCLFNYLNDRKELNLPQAPIYDSLKLFLEKIHNQGIVHGDFRSNNVLVQLNNNTNNTNDTNSDEGFEFKLIDFEFTGKVDSLYPCLALKNLNITWPSDFASYLPRKFEHDVFMLEKMMNE